MRRQRLNKIIGSNVNVYLKGPTRKFVLFLDWTFTGITSGCVIICNTRDDSWISLATRNGKFNPTINIWNKCKYIFGNFINRKYIGMMAERLSWRNVDRMQPCIVSNEVPGSTFWHGRQCMEQPLAVSEFLGKCKYHASWWKLNKVLKSVFLEI